MTTPSGSAVEPQPLSPGDRWRQAWLVVLAAVLVLLTVVAVGRPFDSEPGPPGRAAVAVSPAGSPSSGPSAVATDEVKVPVSPSVSPSPVPSPTPTSVFPPAGVLKLNGAGPVKGSGRFDYANERGPIAGSGGRLHRFKVAVERGSGEDVAAFTAQVRAVLEDDRSWSGSGTVRMQMVAGADQADFTVYLATRETAGRMCEAGGTDIRIGGVPFTSCRAVGKAIINLDRWRLSARPYLQAGVDLASYRQYVINHEVGHELGHRHEGCPKPGGPAPVMVQQTLLLRGCVPWPWPRYKNRDLVGPRL